MISEIKCNNLLESPREEQGLVMRRHCQSPWTLALQEPDRTVMRREQKSCKTVPRNSPVSSHKLRHVALVRREAAASPVFSFAASAPDLGSPVWGLDAPPHLSQLSLF